MYKKDRINTNTHYSQKDCITDESEGVSFISWTAGSVELYVGSSAPPIRSEFPLMSCNWLERGTGWDTEQADPSQFVQEDMLCLFLACQ